MDRLIIGRSNNNKRMVPTSCWLVFLYPVKRKKKKIEKKIDQFYNT